MAAKQRLDAELVARGILPGREQAKTAVMAGLVYVNGQKADKAGEPVSPEDTVEYRGETLAYVSRGGLKLEKAMRRFGFSLENLICMDVGASTGGFTDCMLQNGAARVYAVDVGYGQLAWKLRQDPRVQNLERTNIRYITRQEVPETVDFFSVDVSFISLSLVLPALPPLLAPRARAVCLVKPQFEAGREKVGKRGVVRDPATHCEVLQKAVAYAEKAGFGVMGMDYSPIKGPQGNIEYLMALERGTLREAPGVEELRRLVELSHEELDRPAQQKGEGSF